MDDPDVAAFRLKFGVRLVNRSMKVIYLPASADDRIGKGTMTVLAAQARQSDGSWRYLFQASWYGVPDAKYADCNVVRPGESGEVEAVDGQIVLMRDQLPGLGKEAIVRFDFMINCRRPDGEIAAVGLGTEEFSFKLPAELGRRKRLPHPRLF
jgi:hypothetical protein